MDLFKSLSCRVWPYCVLLHNSPGVLYYKWRDSCFLRKNISPLVEPPPAAPAAGAKDAGPSAVP